MSCLLRRAWIFWSFLFIFCSAESILKGGKTTKECEQGTLQEMDSSTCRNLGASQILITALQLVDCRLQMLGKRPLQCAYVRQRDFFMCKHAIDETMVNEILLTLLDVFERCHSHFEKHFATETSSLLKKLSSSTKTAEEMNARLRSSKLPLELIQQVHRIQKDAHIVETVVLKKANALKKKVEEVRRSLSNRSLKPSFTQTIGNNFRQFEDCFHKPTDAEGTGRLHSTCFVNEGLCFNLEQVEWVFSIVSTLLFLIMIYKIERAFSAPVGLVLLVARAYSQGQNYATFLEQFFLETIVGFSLFAIFSMTSAANVRS